MERVGIEEPMDVGDRSKWPSFPLLMAPFFFFNFKKETNLNTADESGTWNP